MSQSTKISLDHLIIRKINKNLNLIINSFVDSVEIVDNNTLEQLRVGGGSLSKEMLKYYANSLAPFDYDKVADNNNTTKDDSYLVNFCLTYDCNMRCSYCYQQFNPSLDRKIISNEKLDKLFEYTTSLKVKGYDVSVGLFGGEPLLPTLKNTNKRIFEFCRKNKLTLGITTNGIGILDNLDLLIPYHGFIQEIGVTIDGPKRYHDRRRTLLKPGDNFDRIINGIKYLVRAGINVCIGINIDPKNIEYLPSFFNEMKENELFNNEHVIFHIGRVDDRTFSSKYRHYFTEAELLEKILKYNEMGIFPKNTRLAFLHSLLYLSERLGISMNQFHQGRNKMHYCWSTTPQDNTIYIDHNLEVYRCTYTVGKKEHSLGALSENTQVSILEQWHKHGLLNLPECQNCRIGTYCSGGCRLSHMEDHNRNCQDEKDNFDYFLNKIFIPNVLKKLSALSLS